MTTESPCIEVCRIDYDTGLCYGCLRTRMEIENWSFMREEDKERLLVELKEREDYYGKWEEGDDR